jgi:RES domain-containing protein
MADIVGWRIVKEKHAKSAFSGEGARIFEGRWNSAGVRMVYCSENLALAALEILVHVQPAILREKFRAFSVTWDARLMIELKKLPKGWNAQPSSSASKKVGDDWIASAQSVVLAVPSVVIPLERTYLLNPAHPEFSKLKIRDVGGLTLDARLKR